MRRWIKTWINNTNFKVALCLLSVRKKYLFIYFYKDLNYIFTFSILSTYCGVGRCRRWRKLTPRGFVLPIKDLLSSSFIFIFFIYLHPISKCELQGEIVETQNTRVKHSDTFPSSPLFYFSPSPRCAHCYYTYIHFPYLKKHI